MGHPRGNERGDCVGGGVFYQIFHHFLGEGGLVQYENYSFSFGLPMGNEERAVLVTGKVVLSIVILFEIGENLDDNTITLTHRTGTGCHERNQSKKKSDKRRKQKKKEKNKKEKENKEKENKEKEKEKKKKRKKNDQDKRENKQRSRKNKSNREVEGENIIPFFLEL